jgi:hypothetical protein
MILGDSTDTSLRIFADDYETKVGQHSAVLVKKYVVLIYS